MTATVQQTIGELHDTLRSYIEATYHIADPRVVAQRRALLNTPGVIFQTPYIESTPRYMEGDTFASMTDIPKAARDAYIRLAAPGTGKPLLFDPPYLHQADAIRTILRDRKNLMIMTGTGSGKTESFLLPILGKFAIEAAEKPQQFADHRAVRAMVLYPMNALVNDQLGRLRAMFGDPRVVSLFSDKAGRAATFARYTSRTPYAGVRTRQKDSRRLKSIGDFFVELENAADRHANGTSRVPSEDERAFNLFETLRSKGKWPAKPSVSDWFGSGRWERDGEFRRAVLRDDEAELITRYEVQTAAPDLLITNYSMLEYMMLRPIERPIFDRTREWLRACPDEKFLIVLDEAHLYRGAQGAEVGLLLRRLRERLAIPVDRFQVICATASFSDTGKADAGKFGAALSGTDAASFHLAPGAPKLRPGESEATDDDSKILAAVDMTKFYGETEAGHNEAIGPFLKHRGVSSSLEHGPALHAALSEYGPFAKLVNETMKAARSFDEIREIVFPRAGIDQGARAVNALLALGSRARLKPDDASLLPCRVHAFHKGLPGLWACMDPNCTELEPDLRGGPTGKLYTQPYERCACHAPVLEYYTCRYCGTSYARAYVRDANNPDRLYADQGQALLTEQGNASEFQPLDLMLEPPRDPQKARETFYDLSSGLLDPDQLGARARSVYLKPQAGGLGTAAGDNTDEQDDAEDGDEAIPDASIGQFVPCGCCERKVRGNKTSIQDHVTKGDQPFQALLAAQIRVQPPSPVPATPFAPLRGRKVLVFSDSRQVAARLAPTLQVFSLRDTIRALLPLGFRDLQRVVGGSTSLDRAWQAVVIAAHRHSVRVRPELDETESMPVLEDVAPGEFPPLEQLLALNDKKPPANLTRAIFNVLRDNLLGLEPLAIASLIEVPQVTRKLDELPPITGLAETPDQKRAVVRAWLRAWVRKSGVWFKDMRDEWWGTGGIVRPHKGEFDMMKHVIASAHKRQFRTEWLPRLIPAFTEPTPAGHRLVARNLTLSFDGVWHRCSQCTSVHRPIPTMSACIDCGSPSVQAFDPNTDAVFNARKGYYREPIVRAMTDEHPTIMSLVAAEHTAQLNAARADDAFSQAERHEMEFQDIDVSWQSADQSRSTSIDVLSSTTTMEVGIDIGALSGVALRNMPPSRANYQQRAGRAGRRGNAVATVVAFGSADSHDDHYFTHPWEMIRGQVIDPRLTLENPDIARRHIRAFILQRYHEARLPHVDQATGANASLFSVLGTVKDFRDGTGPLNRIDFEQWLGTERDALRTSIGRWLPNELSPADRDQLLTEFATDVAAEIKRAIDGATDAPIATDESAEATDAPAWTSAEPDQQPNEQAPPPPELDPQPDNDALVDAAADNLLDRLLYWGVLPRYAFPTDVAPFYVFSPKSTARRAEMEFAPSQGLNVALSQYAPNKQIWIKNKQYTSKAIYSPFPNDRRSAWGRRRLYFECQRCGHAKTEHEFDQARRGIRIQCEACNSPSSFGPAKPWFRPPGFAHPWQRPAPSTPDEPNETAYATRAKLVMPSGAELGEVLNERLRGLAERRHLLVSNSGPDGEGYHYCTRCGRIESVSAPLEDLRLPHAVPYPAPESTCSWTVSNGVVLGADFPSDIALFSLRLEDPFRLPPAHSVTLSAMRTVCEALSKAASRLLQLEVGEILAEYRPALNTEAGAIGSLVEVFLYDTLAGGAGFSPQLAGQGIELFELALDILEKCPEDCGASCYRCLRSFRNRLDHALLDRHVGSQLLRHVLYGGTPPFSRRRAEQSLALLANDVERQFGATHEIQRRFGAAPQSIAPLVVRRRADGKTIGVDVASPIASNVPVFESASSLVVDELLIRRHLGEAVEKVARALD